MAERGTRGGLGSAQAYSEAVSLRRLCFGDPILLGDSPTEVEALRARRCLLLGLSISISNFILLILTLSGVPMSWCWTTMEGVAELARWTEGRCERDAREVACTMR